MRLLIIVVLLALVGAGVFVWASGNHEGRVNTNAAGVAIEGYDPVAYAPAYGGYSARTNRRFLSDVSGNVARANANWPRIRSDLEAQR